MRVRQSRAEFDAMVQQLTEDGIDEVPLQYVDNRKVNSVTLP
jgi:hypothetical protein